jgi:hypothetical protein
MILMTESTASDPELAKNTFDIGTGAMPTSFSASSTSRSDGPVITSPSCRCAAAAASTSRLP